MGQTTLFDVDPEPKRDKHGRKPTQPRGHAATPGSGPDGETCGSCRHKAKAEGTAGHYLKCGLMRMAWTRGRGSDIRAKDAACAKWEAKDA